MTLMLFIEYKLYRRVSGNFSGKLIPAPNPQDMSQIMRGVLQKLLLLFVESTAFKKKHFLKEQSRADSFQNTPEALLFLTGSV